MTTAHSTESRQWIAERSPIAPWLENIFPWLLSFTMHLGMMLVVIATIYFGAKKTIEEKDFIFVYALPMALTDSLGVASDQRGNNDGSESLQDKSKEVKDTWASEPMGDNSRSTDVTMNENLMDIVACSVSPTSGNIFDGSTGGRLAPYGIRSAGGGTGIDSAPRGYICLYPFSRISTSRIVFVLDHSGSMIDSFDFLRDELKKTINTFTPAQSFAVVMVSEKVDVIFPEEKNLVAATPAVKRQAHEFADSLRAAGRNDDLYDPFADGLRKAFSMKPNMIVFLTDGNFDPRLVDETRRLNTNKCRIDTRAFLKVSKEAEEALKTMAADSNGKFKFVTEADLAAADGRCGMP